MLIDRRHQDYDFEFFGLLIRDASEYFKHQLSTVVFLHARLMVQCGTEVRSVWQSGPCL